MREVNILGIGQVPVSKQTNALVQDLGIAAVRAALVDANIDHADALYTGNMLSGILSSQQLLAPLIAEGVDLTGIEATTIEAACGSGGAAFHIGYMAVASGLMDTVIVVGLEKMTHKPLAEASAALATATNWCQEGIHGETFLTLNSKLMDFYMEKYKISADAFAPFALNAHMNGLNNPNALLQKNVGMDTYLNSRNLVSSLRLYDASPICDGAAAIILGTGKRKDNLIQVRASAMATDTVGIHKRKNPIDFQGIAKSTFKALQQANLTHSDIDLFELHDAYTVISAISLESAGFAEHGTATHQAKDGIYNIDGKLPISTMGGLKSRGHPVGATGIYQLVECVKQLTGEAGKNQINNPKYAMSQNIGGSGSIVATHIVERRNN